MTIGCRRKLAFAQFAFLIVGQRDKRCGVATRWRRTVSAMNSSGKHDKTHSVRARPSAKLQLASRLPAPFTHQGARLMNKPAAMAAALCAVMSTAHAATDTTDLWDTHQGTLVTASSPIHFGSNASDMFGATLSSIESGNTLFFDSAAAGSLHFVEWTTPQPVTVGRFDLYAVHDAGFADAHQRGFSHFSLQAFNPDSHAFEERYSFSPDNPYSLIDANSGLLLSASIESTTASQWRAQFIQFGPPSNAAGVRIIELDGFESPRPVPLPAAVWLLGSAMLMPALRARRHRAQALG